MAFLYLTFQLVSAMWHWISIPHWQSSGLIKEPVQRDPHIPSRGEDRTVQAPYCKAVHKLPPATLNAMKTSLFDSEGWAVLYSQLPHLSPSRRLPLP